MRRFCLNLSFLLAALVVAPNANAQGGLSLNQTYRDVIRLHFRPERPKFPCLKVSGKFLAYRKIRALRAIGFGVSIWLI